MAQRFDANSYPLSPGVRLLEASAGTGKTFALAHLCLRLITEADHALDSLLVVTFTDAAAEELRSRIGQRLQQALQGLEQLEQGRDASAPDPVLEDWLAGTDSGDARQLWIRRLLVALEQLDRADITTIHGFCRRSLRRLALSNGAAMEPQLDPDATALQAEVVQDLWQQELLSLPPDQLKGLRQRGLSPQALRRGLAQLDGEQQPRFRASEAAIDVDGSLAPQLDHWVAQLWEDFLPLWHRDHAALDAGFRQAAEQWKAQGCGSTTPYSAKPKSDRCAQINQWLSVQTAVPSLLEIASHEKPLKEYFHPSSWCRIARKCGETDPSLVMTGLQAAIAALWDAPLERAWQYLLERGLQELDRRRRRRGVITFAGLLAAMDPGDGDVAWLASLQQRYRAVMVDEFQDTDPVQWRLLQRAFGDGERHLLLMVGDPKQAIYRFRGGDLATYMAARQQVERIDHLLDNFRTTAPLMEALNRLMAPGLSRSGLPVPAVQPRSSAMPPQDAAALQLQLISTELPSTRSALEEEMPQRLAAMVLEQLQQQDNLNPADLCVLVSRHQQAEALRRALGAFGLPTRLVTQGDVLESEAALLLQWFLDALAEPGDDVRLRLLACSGLMGIPPNGLDQDRLDQLALQLRGLAELMPRLGLLGALADLLKGEQLAGLSERGRMLGDLQQAARLVQEAMHRQGLDVATAADWLRRERLHPSRPVPEARQPHSDQADSAIAVVTVHRSKGLEYPVVICPYLWESPPAVAGPLWRDLSSGECLVRVDVHWGEGWQAAQQAQQEAMAEAERLAYVAVTRAKSQLILIWARAFGQEGSPMPAWLFDAEAAGDAIESLTDQRLSDALGEREVSVRISPLAESLPSGARWRPPLREEMLALGPIPKRIDRSWGRASYSAWIASSDEIRLHEHGRDRDPGAEDVVSAVAEPEWSETGPLAAFPRGAAAGDCLHRILEQFPFTAAEAPEPSERLELIAAELRRAGLDPGLQNDVLTGLDQVLQTPLGGPLGSLSLDQLGPDQRLPELSFDLPVQHVRTADLVAAFAFDAQARFGASYSPALASLSINSRGFLTGSIDLVFQDPQHKRWWVLDWKSNWIGERRTGVEPGLCGPHHYSQDAMEDQMLHHHYPLQAHLYLVALHRHLRWRLPDYAPERHLGGYVYCFLRGMPGSMSASPEGPVGPGRIVESVPLDRIAALDRALSEVMS
ncbi:UvrD-helicase domain-containing protein [Synechococcus sp. MU1611]|uniref:UvrD-helicase domain-containing protein n=1 Tax=Synechococcus sp. MU1611 TaxID=2508345 RepID=UPI001CF8140C|nr:UvrD-helicase domain-containing protein [Synechococcus sp. MU1611]MCB4410597.1 AAA family ATPase [Synechococcus sp. MU1611]